MEMPKPTAHHEKLHVLAGSWVGEEKMHPSPWDPKGGTAQAYMEARVDLDGMYVIRDYRQERDGKVTYRGHGVYGYDEKKSTYVMYWFDSMGIDPKGPARGTWEGDTLTFEMKNEAGGSSRYVYKFNPDQSGHTFSIFMSNDGQLWNVWLESTYKRADT